MVAGEGRLSFREKLAYGFGDFGFSLPYNMVSGFLLYYYTNIVHLPAAAVGTIFLLARLLDVVIDMLVGIAVDKTRSRWGRTRPYFLFTAIPYVAIFIAVFSMPDWGQNAQLVYAFVTFKLLGIFMSLQKNSFRTDLVLAAVLVTALLSVALFGLTHLVQRLVIPWYGKDRRGRA